MVEQVVIICQAYFYTFPLYFFPKSVLNWSITPRWILTFSNEGASHEPSTDKYIYIYSWSTTQCYNVWQWKDKLLDGVNSQREEVEEDEWGYVVEELGGKTEEVAEGAEDSSWWDKSHTCRPHSQSWACNGWGWSKGAAKFWENNCVLNHSDFLSTEQVCNLTIGTVL